MPGSDNATNAWLSQTTHYENFPVGSVLVPKRLRPSMAAVYRFARYGDDVADEGDAPADRLAELARLRAALYEQTPHPVVDGLHPVIEAHQIDRDLFSGLLEAFEWDARGTSYPDFARLRQYCQRSADPVGRIVLSIFSMDRPAALPPSDSICTALQLINFAQDLGQDTTRGRCYIPEDELTRFGLDHDDLEQCVQQRRISAPVRALLDFQLDRALAMLQAGVPLLAMVRGRLRWELTAVVAGGHTMLTKTRCHDPFAQRLKLNKTDLPTLLRTSLQLLFGRPLR